MRRYRYLKKKIWTILRGTSINSSIDHKQCEVKKLHIEYWVSIYGKKNVSSSFLKVFENKD